MQKLSGKTLVLLISIFSFFQVQGQSQLRFETPEGFAAKDVSVMAWTAFGLEIFVTKDSQNGIFFIPKAFGRLKVSGKNYMPFDTIFKPEVPLGSVLKLQLIPIAQFLDQAVISVSKSEVKLKESFVSISILKPYIIENKISIDMSQALEQVPGVNVADNQINIRNGNGWSYGAGSRVMVLVDELPMLSGDAQTAQFSFIPVENVGSVEVVKSAGSVLYGSSALNGIVHVRSADPTEKASARVSAFAGFYDAAPRDSLNWSPRKRYAYGSNGFFSQKLNGTDFTISFNALNNQGYRMNEFEQRGRLSLRLARTAEKGYFGLEKRHLKYGLNLSAQTGKSGSFLLWESFGYGYIPLDSGFNFTRSNRISIDPFIQYSNNSGFSHKILGRIYLLDNQIDNGNPNNNQSNGSSFYYGEYKSQWRPNAGKWLFTGGLVAMAAETHSPLFSGKHRSKNLAAYFQSDFRYRRLNAAFGARMEHFKLDQFEQTKPVFRAGVNYILTRFTFLRASWGQGFRFPSMAEAFISTSAGNVNIYPNPDLKPETGNNAEIGIKQGFRIANFKGYADLAAFRTTYQNLMEFTFAQWKDPFNPGLGLGFKSVNIGTVRIQGFEVETGGQGKIKNAEILLLGGYTYTVPESVFPDSIFAYNFSGSPLSFSSTRAENTNYLKYRFKHLFRIDLQINYKGFEPGISFRYNSMMLNMDRVFVTLVDPSIGTAWKTLGAARIVDVRLGYHIHRKWKLHFQVLNLFNSLYMNRPADLRPPRSFQLQGSWFL